MAVFNKTIIPLAIVGYEMIIANSVLCALLANPTRAHGIIFKYMCTKTDNYKTCYNHYTKMFWVVAYGRFHCMELSTKIFLSFFLSFFLFFEESGQFLAHWLFVRRLISLCIYFYQLFVLYFLYIFFIFAYILFSKM